MMKFLEFLRRTIRDRGEFLHVIFVLAVLLLGLVFVALIASTQARAAQIKIATWNLHNFGPTGVMNRDRLSKVASVMDDYDIVAVQEIFNATGTVLSGIQSALGANWAFSVIPRNTSHSTRGEQYGFFYNTTKISPVGTGARYPDTGTQFDRDPWAAQFETKRSTSNFRFVLITTHTTPTRAVAEINNLHEVVLWARRQWSAEDDFIVLGDYNAGCTYASVSQLNSGAAAFRSTAVYKWIVEDTAKTNVAPGKRCAYDRIVVNLQTSNANPNYAGTWMVDQPFTSAAISDHWPVWASFHDDRDGTRTISPIAPSPRPTPPSVAPPPGTTGKYRGLSKRTCCECCYDDTYQTGSTP